MVAAERAEALDVLVSQRAAGDGDDVVDRALGVDGVVENDRVHDQAERVELFFLAVTVRLAELAAAAVADVAGKAMAAFAAHRVRERRRSQACPINPRWWPLRVSELGFGDGRRTLVLRGVIWIRIGRR